MKISPFVLAVALATLSAGASSTAFAAQSSVRHHHVRRVSRITTLHQVDYVLHQNRNLNGARAYAASPDVIVLYGNVFNDQDKALAEQSVMRVHGVHRVVNNLGTTTGQWMAEQDRIDTQLHNNGFNDVQARVIGPDVYLSGQVVGTYAQKQRASEVAATVSNKQVDNMIWVKPGSIWASLF